MREIREKIFRSLSVQIIQAAIAIPHHYPDTHRDQTRGKQTKGIHHPRYDYQNSSEGSTKKAEKRDVEYKLDSKA